MREGQGELEGVLTHASQESGHTAMRGHVKSHKDLSFNWEKSANKLSGQHVFEMGKKEKEKRLWMHMVQGNILKDQLNNNPYYLPACKLFVPLGASLHRAWLMVIIKEKCVK